MECPKCDGCGKVATDDDQSPWTRWERLPAGSDFAVRFGVVKPVECPECGGSGTIEPAPVPSKAEVERLAVLAEELGEACQAVGKVLRFGWDSYHPRLVERGSNREMLETELGHVLSAIRLLSTSGDVEIELIESAAERKTWSRERWLRNQKG